MVLHDRRPDPWALLVMRQRRQGLSEPGWKHRLAWGPTSRLFCWTFTFIPTRYHSAPTVVLHLRSLRQQQHGVSFGESPVMSLGFQSVSVALWSYWSTECGPWARIHPFSRTLNCPVYFWPPLGFQQGAFHRAPHTCCPHPTP